MQPWQGAPRTYGIGVAPFSYWQRSLDMYTLVQQMVDQAIGDVLAAIPKPVLANTVIVFAADHGDYAGAFTQTWRPVNNISPAGARYIATSRWSRDRREFLRRVHRDRVRDARCPLAARLPLGLRGG